MSDNYPFVVSADDVVFSTSVIVYAFVVVSASVVSSTAVETPSSSHHGESVTQTQIWKI